MINRRSFLTLSSLSLLSSTVPTKANSSTSENTKAIEQIYSYLLRFSKNQNHSFLLEGTITHVDIGNIKEFNFSSIPDWPGVELLLKSAGYTLRKYTGYSTAAKNHVEFDYLLQYRPKEFLKIFKSIVQKTGFVYYSLTDIHKNLASVLPGSILNSDTVVPVGQLPRQVQEQVYSLLLAPYCLRQASAYMSLISQLESSLLSSGEFQWFDLFQTGEKAFGYRARTTTTGSFKELVLSHGFSSPLEGNNQLAASDTPANARRFVFNRIDVPLAQLAEPIQVRIRALKYTPPEALPYVYPSCFRTGLLQELKTEFKGMVSEPEDMERFYCFIGSKPDSSASLQLLQDSFGLTISSNGTRLITNPAIKSYKAPYQSWLVGTLPLPLARFVQAHLNTREERQEKGLPTLADRLLAHSDQIIRTGIEAELGKGEKVRIAEVTPLVQMAFVNRLFAQFCLSGGLENFEMPDGATPGLRARFPELQVWTRIDEAGRPTIDIGVVSASGKKEALFSASPTSVSTMLPW